MNEVSVTDLLSTWMSPSQGTECIPSTWSPPLWQQCLGTNGVSCGLWQNQTSVGNDIRWHGNLEHTRGREGDFRQGNFVSSCARCAFPMDFMCTPLSLVIQWLRPHAKNKNKKIFYLSQCYLWAMWFMSEDADVSLVNLNSLKCWNLSRNSVKLCDT